MEIVLSFLAWYLGMGGYIGIQLMKHHPDYRRVQTLRHKYREVVLISLVWPWLLRVLLREQGEENKI